MQVVLYIVCFLAGAAFGILSTSILVASRGNIDETQEDGQE